MTSLWLSSAEEIRKKYKNDHITLICKHEYFKFLSSLVLFDSIIAVDLNKFFKNPKYHFSTLRIIRKNNYNLLLNPMYSRSIKSDLFTKLIYAKRKIGYCSDTSCIRKTTKLITDKWYTKLISDNTSIGHQHEILRNFNFKTNWYTSKSKDLFNESSN